jgi:hypothetical protein
MGEGIQASHFVGYHLTHSRIGKLGVEDENLFQTLHTIEGSRQEAIPKRMEWQGEA